MRYGSPSIESAVKELRDWGAERLLLFPLYPQYAGATTGSTYDEVFKQLSLLRFCAGTPGRPSVLHRRGLYRSARPVGP